MYSWTGIGMLVDDSEKSATVRANRTAAEVILVVEDDEHLVDVYRKALEHAGYRVLASGTAEGAIEIAEGFGPIDLLVTDLVLKKMGGRELVWRLRSKQPELPVILASGFTNAHGALQLMDDESIDFLPKPIDLGELIALVRRKLSSASGGS